MEATNEPSSKRVRLREPLQSANSLQYLLWRYFARRIHAGTSAAIRLLSLGLSVARTRVTQTKAPYSCYSTLLRRQWSTRSCASTCVAHERAPSGSNTHRLIVLCSTCPAVAHAVMQISQPQSLRRSSELETMALEAHVWRYHCQQASIELLDTNTAPAVAWNPRTGGLVTLARAYTSPATNTPSWQQRFWEAFVQSCIDIVANSLFMGDGPTGGGSGNTSEFEQTTTSSQATLHRVFDPACTWLSVPSTRMGLVAMYAAHVRSIRIPAVVLRAPESVVWSIDSAAFDT